MNFYEEILISGIPIPILLIILARIIFKKVLFVKSIRWIKLIIIIQGILSLLSIVFSLITYQQGNELIDRISGEYGFAYLLIILSSTTLPFLLFWNKIRKNLWTLLSIAIFMNMGRIYESFVILVTSFYRDYGSFFVVNEFEIIIFGFLTGLLILGFDKLTQKWDLAFSIKRFNPTPLYLIICIGILFVSGQWFTSIYGFDPPYGYFYSGLILQAASLLSVFLLILYHFDLTFNHLINKTGINECDP